jgi:high affinity Mn2+ porin
VPNSTELETRVIAQNQYALEFEERHAIGGQPGKLKLLGFVMHGRMGAYDAATSLAQVTGMPAEITAVRRQHTKAGLGLNLEQQLAPDLGVFARAGFTQGRYEAFEFTDINKTVSFGLSLAGGRWGRPKDTLGLAMAVNDASSAAKRFFNAGGLGILAGDGQLLRSGAEQIVETYYSFAPFGFARLSVDYQFINHPAYNRDRGPVSVVGIRVHGEF